MLGSSVCQGQTRAVDQSNHPSRPPPTLQSVPTEILSQVVRWLDRNSAIVLARTARRFTTVAEQKIWQQLDLRLHPNFGEHPWIVPHACNDPAERALYEDWRDNEGWRAEARHKAGLREKMKTILFRADERRAGLVREVTVIPRPGCVMSQAQIIDMVSPDLRSLAVDIAPYFSHQRVGLFHIPDTLDYSLVATRMSFPHLTHLYLGYHAIHFIGLISLLCAYSPNLVSFDVGREVDVVMEDDPPPFAFRILEQETKLQRFRILRDNDEDLDDEDDGNPHVLAVLKQSPLLRDVAIETTWFTESQKPKLLDLLRGLSHLQNLYMAESLGSLLAVWGDDVLSPCVSSLIVDTRVWWYMFKFLPNAPTLQAVYLDSLSAEELNPPMATFSLEGASLRPMIPSFAAGLRRCPQLHTIHTATGSAIINREARIELFDRLELTMTEDKSTGRIRSLTHCGAEVLHARMVERYIELSDEPRRHGPQPGDLMRTRYCYVARDGSERMKTFKALPEGEEVCTDYTDFDGLKVPLEVFHQMRRVEGASEKDWMGRGIEVSEAAWKVLTDWRDGIRDEGQGEERM